MPIVERWDWGCWRTILGIVEEHQPDVVHVQYQAAAYAMHPAINLLPWRLRRLGDSRPLSAVTFHDLRVPYLFPKAGPVRRWVVNELARRSDAAITTNREDLKSLERELGTAPALIPIGSNINPKLPAGYDRDAWRGRWGVGADDLLLCFFGFINARKGVDTLLHALRLLVSDSFTGGDPLSDVDSPRPDAGRKGRIRPSQRPSRFKLLMIGGKTGASDPTNVAYLNEIQALISSLNLEDRVLWTGYVLPEEVSASFSSADLCVLPYRDGVSFLHGTLHAALVHGVPIVTTQPRVPLPELRHGDNVYLVPVEQPQALATAIAHLAAHPDLSNTLAKGALALSTHFRWPNIAASTLELYHSLQQDA
jgi:glycosyltransferase involved in cell wall biosynthesis